MPFDQPPIKEFPPATRMIRSWNELKPGLVIYFMTQFRVFPYTIIRKKLQDKFPHQKYVLKVYKHRPDHPVRRHLFFLFNMKDVIRLGWVWTNDEYEDVSKERKKPWR